MAQVVEVQAGRTRRSAGAVPDGPKVRPPQRSALRSEKTRPAPRLREAFEMPCSSGQPAGNETVTGDPPSGFRTHLGAGERGLVFSDLRGSAAPA